MLATLLAVATLASSCVDDPESLSTATTTTVTSTVPTSVGPTTSTTEPKFPSSPSSLEEVLGTLDGLYAAYVLQAPTVGLDPLSVRGDPTDLIEAVDAERLMDDVRALSMARGSEAQRGLRTVAALVEDGFGDAGYRSVATPVEVDSGDDVVDAPMIEVKVPGSDCEERVVMVTAHYDAVEGSPGARDASGVAAMLEVARQLAEAPLPMTVRFVALPFGAEEPEAAEQLVDSFDDRVSETVAGFALDGVGVVGGEEDDDLVGVPPHYLLLVGNKNSEYLARVVAITTARFLPQFWAFSSIPELHLFPEFLDRDAQPWWETGRQALLVTDRGAERDERVGTEDDEPAIIDQDFLANSVRTVMAGLVGVGTIDAEGDNTPDVCQRDW